MRDDITSGLLECSLPAPRGEPSGSHCKLTLDGYGFGVDFVAKPPGCPHGGGAIYLTVAPCCRDTMGCVVSSSSVGISVGRGMAVCNSDPLKGGCGEQLE